MPYTEIDAIDRSILMELQNDGRASNVELAERINLSESPCLRRTRRLEQNGYITGYRAVLDRASAGFGLTVFVSFRVERHNRENADRLSRAIADIPEVVSCHMVSGAADFIAEVVVRDLIAYEQLLTERLLSLPAVTDIQSTFSLRTVKTDGALPIRPGDVTS